MSEPDRNKAPPERQLIPLDASTNNSIRPTPETENQPIRAGPRPGTNNQYPETQAPQRNTQNQVAEARPSTQGNTRNQNAEAMGFGILVGAGVYHDVPPTPPPSSTHLGNHNPKPTHVAERSSTSALEKIENFYITHTEQSMTLSDFNAVADEIVQLMTRKKIDEMQELTRLIERMAAVVTSRYEAVDKPALVERLVQMKYEFESFDECYNTLRRSLMTIIIDD